MKQVSMDNNPFVSECFRRGLPVVFRWFLWILLRLWLAILLLLLLQAIRQHFQGHLTAASLLTHWLCLLLQLLLHQVLLLA